jgi:3-hydroxyacyl-CoA dehydrogenase
MAPKIKKAKIEKATIKKVAVIGSGVMGSGIAAQVANAGIPCLLLDIVPKNTPGGATSRNQLAEAAIARMLKAKPAPLMHPANAKLIRPGNLEDDLGQLKTVDWICEVVIENIDIKRDLYKKIDAVRKPGSIVTSNTSTIPLHQLIEGRSAAFAKDFAVTHFFNPPRYMRLLELVAGKKTRPDAIAGLRAFADVRLGKEVVDCKDTPGFIANRIGIFWSYIAMSKAIEHGLTIEETDAIIGKPMGIPKTGIFGLADLTGIDLAPHVNESMLRLLPKDDAFCRAFDPKGALATTVAKLISEGMTGRKGKGGFYRAKGKEVLDFKTGQYRALQKADLEAVRAGKKGLRALAEYPDKYGAYAKDVLLSVLGYCASLLPEVADDILAVDAAMRNGYAWKTGPFQQIDQLGSDWLARELKAAGHPVPALLQTAQGRPFYKTEAGRSLYLTVKGDYAEIPVPADAWTLADKKRNASPIASNRGASLWDVGDGVACLEFHSKMNSIDADILAMVGQAARIHEKGFKALIIGNDADNFSVGANLGMLLFQANIAMWPLIEQALSAGQQAYMALKYAPFPVVAAPAGLTLGGGCEIVLHAAAVQAHAETYIGLVELGVGLVPGWGGCKELITRAYGDPNRAKGPMPPLAEAFEPIATAKVATSAQEARDLRILRPSDAITMNRARLLADAKRRALAMVKDYKPPVPVELNLAGASGRAALGMVVEGFVQTGKASRHDQVVSAALARVLTGGDRDTTEPTSEKALLDLEREGLMALIKTEGTLERMEHMLTTGKPLRN